jgi:predicted TIM-barrel fold metal-dependent hydrolase
MTRRTFIRAFGSMLAIGGIGGGLWATGRRSLATGPVLDCHVHLFGVGSGNGFRHKREPWIAPTQKRHWNYRFLLRLLKIDPTVDMEPAYVRRLVDQMRESNVTRAWLMGYDCRYGPDGLPDAANTSSVYVPNEYVFQVVSQYDDLFCPCPSINPQRADWESELEFCVQHGSRVLKIHPPTQDVNPADPRFRDFYRACVSHDVAVMVHTGTEHSAAIVSNTLSDPYLLRLALDEGCTVIAAHAGMSNAFDSPADDFFPHLQTMMREYPRLYCDTAVLASMFRWRCVPRILRDPIVVSRTLHGSDFPFPSNPAVFWHRMPPRTLLRLLSVENLLDRDWMLKRALGLPPEVFNGTTIPFCSMPTGAGLYGRSSRFQVPPGYGSVTRFPAP